ncbi:MULTISPECIES: hypothetical protein [Francisella]|uniref:hypothetical protein n=1 Tax=Francisella TaxID=262 RepID=UPI0011B77C61|nr:MULTISPECIES: hypothetical protein [Francisella]
MVSDFKLSEQSEFLKSQAVLHTFSALKKVCRYSLRSKQRNFLKNIFLFQTPQEVSTLELPESTRGNYPCYYIDSDNTKHTVAYDQLTDAQKQSAKSMLCIDHSAMLYPTDDFMNYIYKGQLFGDPDLGLGFFGDYDMDEVRGNNSKYNKR